MILEKPMSISSQITTRGVILAAPLAQFTGGSIPLAGGKGANLGELSHLGFDVPAGFVITTAAYDLALQREGLQTEISAGLASLTTFDPASVRSASERIRTAIQDAPISLEIVEQILAAYRQLGSGPVAVRSSATTEDLPGAAFAGQQETFLNIQGEGPLLEAVKSCWASLWSERAILYRNKRNLEQESAKIAVVVQQMVFADAAGVVFTADPVSGVRDELVIAANPGLGEAVVGGMVTPDHWVVRKHRLRIKEWQPGRREVIIRPKAGGGTEQIIQDDVNNGFAALPPQAVRKLARLGLKIERHFGSPQDIEWAWLKDRTQIGRFFILQSRPMTGLPEPQKAGGAMQRILPILAEMWPERPYPLDRTTFSGALESALGDFLKRMLGKSAPDPGKTFYEEDGVVVRFEPPEFHPSPMMVFSLFGAFWRTRRCEPSAWEADPSLKEALAKAGELEARDLRSLTWEENIETLHEALALLPLFMDLRERYLPPAILGLAKIWLLLSLAGRRDRFGLLMGGVETKTSETNLALQSLAAQIRSDPNLRDLFDHCCPGELLSKLKGGEVGGEFWERFTAFLHEYGHRELALTISQGAWKNHPETVLGMLKVLAAAEAPEVGSYRAWVLTRDELLAHSILGKQPFRKPFIDALADGRAFFKIREDTHFYITLVLPLIRRVALELGERLSQIGALARTDDIFHLRLEELEGLGEPWPPTQEIREQIQALVNRRREMREALSTTPLIDPRLLAVTSTAPGREDILLSGAPGSPGFASGPVRIVRDGSEFGKLQPGDVLVAPVTNPAWTPLFQLAKAVVVDTGGAASHAAIVAREYGVPAVMGTVFGTQRLVDGQWIQVDGTRGLVLKVEAPKEIDGG
jgi:pyruvate,water dikinase